ncbi:Antiseptic resistance protein [Nocardia otitidiscaviarum]|uniref:Antiseptic resistance protein n=1 Tax=Nocardia otitidiscaviarum TaxID=1823 RepID=A0A378X5W9_9NOCA|nr:MFS transporter [Nocardia otitidiscaviarum]SUA49010.1 Antiseptic resistance protein [Nocardia otitidiscaviarum]
MDTPGPLLTAAETSTGKGGRREWAGLAVLALACLVYSMDLTVLHLAVPQISAELRPTSTQLLWIIDVYGFFVAGLLLTMGTIGDRVGRRRLLMVGAAAFAAVSIIAAFAPTAPVLIACRALLGVAGATLAPSTLSLIFTMFRDPAQRSVAIGVWVGSYSVGGAIGPLAGGLVLEHFWWGAVFLLAVPVMVLLIVLAPRILPEFRDPDAGKLDPISAVLCTGAVLLVVFGMKQAAQDGPGPQAVMPLLAGLGVGLIFVRRQLSSPEPMLNLRLFRLGSFRTALTINLLAIFVAFGYFLFVAQYLQLVLEMSPLRAGLATIPAGLGFMIGSQLGPRIGRVVRPAYMIGGGMAMAAVGLLLLTQISVTGGVVLTIIASLLVSFGLAPVFGITTELIVGTAPQEQAGAASGLAETGAEFGGALGISILGSVSIALYRTELAATLPYGLREPDIATARDTLGAAINLANALPGSLGATVADAAKHAFLTGMHVTAAIAAGAALVLSALALSRLRHIPPG